LEVSVIVASDVGVVFTADVASTGGGVVPNEAEEEEDGEEEVEPYDDDDDDDDDVSVGLYVEMVHTSTPTS